MPTNTSLSLTLEINNEPVTISTDSLTSLVFTLPRPIDFGTWDNFANYIHENWGLPAPKLEQPIGVKALDDTYKALTETAHLKLTTLTINQPTATYEIGVSVDFSTDPPGLIPGVKFRSLGVKIRIEPEKFALPAKLEQGATTLAILDTSKDKEWVNASQILIGKEAIDVSSADGKSWTFKPTGEEHAQGTMVLLWATKKPETTPTPPAQQLATPVIHEAETAQKMVADHTEPRRKSGAHRSDE